MNEWNNERTNAWTNKLGKALENGYNNWTEQLFFKILENGNLGIFRWSLNFGILGIIITKG